MPAMISVGRCVCVILGLTTLANAEPPVISSPTPISVQPGTTIERVFSGSNFTNETRLWTSFPCETKRSADTDGKSIRFAMTVPPTTSLGLGTLRLINHDGTSPLQMVVVDDLPSVPGHAKNTTPETAQTVTLPTAITGSVGKAQRQYFRFSVEAGQRVAVDVLAQRIGSALDPAIRILEPSGRELVFSDDEPGLGGDARLSHIFSQPGEYLLELRDIRYQGGSGYWYHLRIGDFPDVTVPYPLAVPIEKTTNVELESRTGSELISQAVTPPVNQDWLTMAVRHENGPSAFVTLEVSYANETYESEPNDTPEQANPVTLGDHLNGRFETPGDVDRFRFQATKGQKFQFRAVTREAGSPVDLVLSLRDRQGKKLAEVDDMGTSDAILEYTFAADGEYELLANDLNQRGGPGFVYRIVVGLSVPDLNIFTDADHLNVPSGGTAVLKVHRTGSKKPVKITVGNLPAGWSIPPTVLGPGQMEGVLTVTHTNDSASPSFVPAIQPVGSLDDAKAGLYGVSVHPAIQKRYSQWTTVPRFLPTPLAIATTDSTPFQLTMKTDSIEVHQKSEAKIEVTAVRSTDTNEPIELSLQTITVNKKAVPFLPANVTAKFEPISKDDTTGLVTFSANEKATPGDYTVVVLGTIKRGKQTIVVPAASILLKIRPAQPEMAK